MGLFDWLFGAYRMAVPLQHQPKQAYSQQDISIIAGTAQRIVDVVNESLKIANESNIPETKVSRLGVAKEKLGELKDLVVQYPLVAITSLKDVERSIAELTLEFKQAGYFDTVKPLSLAEFAERDRNSDIISGWVFTMHLTIHAPLSGLIHYGEVVDLFAPKPQYPYGGWVSVTKTFRELGIDVDEPARGTHASDIGQVDSREYAAFLMQYRAIVEAEHLAYRDKVAHIQAIPGNTPDFKGIYKRLEEVYPGFPESVLGGRITDIPGIGKKTMLLLFQRGIRSQEDLRILSDSELAKIPGFGQKTIDAIRQRGVI